MSERERGREWDLECLVDGMVDCIVVQGAFNTILFTEFISGLLDKMNPFPLPRSVIVMDNCAIYNMSEFRDG